MLAADQQRLHGELVRAAGFEARRRVRGVPGGRRLVELRRGPRADRLARVEDPAELPLSLGRAHLDREHGPLAGHRGAQGQTARGGDDRAGQLGVPQVQPPVDAGDRAGGLQREVPDRQPGQAEQRAEFRTVVLHLRVLDGEADRVRTRLGVDPGAEEAVAEERPFVPGLRQPPPAQVGAGQEIGPAAVAQVALAPQPAASAGPGPRWPGSRGGGPRQGHRRPGPRHDPQHRTPVDLVRVQLRSGPPWRAQAVIVTGTSGAARREAPAPVVPGGSVLIGCIAPQGRKVLA